MRSTLAVAAIAIGLLNANASAQTPGIENTYNFTVISFPQALFPGPLIQVVNDSGTFAGNYYTGSVPVVGQGVFNLPYVESGGVVTTFEIPGAPQPPFQSIDTGASVSGISNQGAIVGFSQTHPPGFPTYGYIGWMFKNGLASTLPLIPVAINSGGEILGSLNQPNGQGVTYKNGVLTPVAVPGALTTTVVALNNAGDIAGNYSLSTDTDTRIRHGFLYSNGRFTKIDYPGALSTLIIAVNDRDGVVGNYVIRFQDEGPPIMGGFIFQNGQYTNIPLPPDALSVENVAGVNSQGAVVGNYGTSNRIRGFVYVNGRTSPFDFPSEPGGSTTLFGINNGGEIIGYNGLGFTATPGGNGSVNNPTFTFKFVGE